MSHIILHPDRSDPDWTVLWPGNAAYPYAGLRRLENKIFNNENEKGELLPALSYVYTGQRNETDMLFAVKLP